VKKEEYKKDIHSGLVFMLMSIFIFIGSFYIPKSTSDILGSRFFPRVVSGLILLLSMILAIKGLIKVRAMTDGDEKKQSSRKYSKPLLLTVFILFVYYLMVLYIGFTVTSILYIFFQSLILMQQRDFKNRKKLIILVVVSIVIPIVINSIFLRVFSIILPVGRLFA